MCNLSLLSLTSPELKLHFDILHDWIVCVEPGLVAFCWRGWGWRHVQREFVKQLWGCIWFWGWPRMATVQHVTLEKGQQNLLFCGRGFFQMFQDELQDRTTRILFLFSVLQITPHIPQKVMFCWKRLDWWVAFGFFFCALAKRITVSACSLLCISLGSFVKVVLRRPWFLAAKGSILLWQMSHAKLQKEASVCFSQMLIIFAPFKQQILTQGERCYKFLAETNETETGSLAAFFRELSFSSIPMSPRMNTPNWQQGPVSRVGRARLAYAKQGNEANGRECLTTSGTDPWDGFVSFSEQIRSQWTVQFLFDQYETKFAVQFLQGSWLNCHMVRPRLRFPSFFGHKIKHDYRWAPVNSVNVNSKLKKNEYISFKIT